MSDRSEPSVADRVRRSTPRLRLRESETLRAGIRHRFGDARQVSPSGWTSVNAPAGRARRASVFGRQVFVGEPVAGSSFRSRCAGFEAAEIGGLAGVVGRHGEMLDTLPLLRMSIAAQVRVRRGGLPVSEVMPVRRHLRRRIGLTQRGLLFVRLDAPGSLRSLQRLRAFPSLAQRGERALHSMGHESACEQRVRERCLEAKSTRTRSGIA